MFEIIFGMFIISLLMFCVVLAGVVMDMKNILKLIWYRLIGGNKSNKNEIQFGELFVTEKGKSEIELSCVPKLVKVEFKDNQNCVPCDPHHDKLSWDIKKRHGRYLFVIKWHVSGLREIKWVLFY